MTGRVEDRRRRGVVCAAGAVALATLALAGPAGAQAREPRVEVSAGGLWASPVGLGTRAATETMNQPGGGRYTLFTTRSELGALRGLEVRASTRLRRWLAVEVGGSWGRRRLSTSVSGDVEGAASLTATVDVDQYVLDGSVRLAPSRLARAGGRVAPFVVAGAGYVRQVYAGRTLVETGAVSHAGGGMLVWLRAPRAGRPPRLGVRGDLRWALSDGGVTLGGPRRHQAAVAAAGAVFRF